MKLSNVSYGDLVSVIVPAYNHEQFIVSALDSVAAQTYGPLELIVVDDVSRDHTAETIAEWMSILAHRNRFARIKLLRNEKNSGAHATINSGIVASSGSVTTVLNSDDLFTSHRLEKIVKAMADQEAKLAFSKIIPVDEYDSPIPSHQLPQALVGVFDQVDLYTTCYPTIGFGFLGCNVAISTGNLVFSRELFDQVGPFRSLRYVHDWDFVLRSLRLCEPILVPETLYLYRIHGSNSFSELANVAEIETSAVERHFWELMNHKHVSNHLAPIPRNWPGLFELLAEELPLLARHRAERNNHFRTSEHATNFRKRDYSFRVQT